MIVSPDGYILTNNHVVEQATEIKVVLPDRREFTGKVVGTDPRTDIAVLKIPATGLPTLPLGDSSKLQVGDYCFAIGDPFGIGETDGDRERDRARKPCYRRLRRFHPD